MTINICDGIEIEYGEKSLPYIEEVITYFNGNYLYVMDFFELKSIGKPVKIILNDDYETFKRQLANTYYDGDISKIRPYYNGYAVNEANSKIAIINYMSLPENYQSNSLEDLEKGIIHEFSHICCDAMTNYNYDDTYWVYEGVATFLARQYENSKLTASFEQIKNDEFVEYSNYRCLFDTLVDNYSHEEVLETIKGNHPNDLIDRIFSLCQEKTKKEHKID